jgi:urease accessory protein
MRPSAPTSLLSVLQLSDSAFPTGRYSLSHGLETHVESGLLGPRPRASTLARLLGDAIRHGVGPADGVALACAHRGGGEGADLALATAADERLTAVKLAQEAREASTRTGRALLSLATTTFDVPALARYAERVDAGRAPGNQAVVAGLLSAALGVPRLDAVVGELYAFSAGWVGAAVRLGLIDHRMGQRLLHRVRPVSAQAALSAIDRDVAEIASWTPLVDVMSMRHEQAELRLFAT